MRDASPDHAPPAMPAPGDEAQLPARTHGMRIDAVPHIARGHSAFLTLYRLRRTAFRQQSMALYRRYGQAILVVLALFGILLRERPSLLGEPLLHYWRAPGSWLADLACAGAWMALVAAWVSIHRGFIRGGTLARYARSLPLHPRTAGLVDLAILGLGLRVFLLPFRVAAGVAAGFGNAAGADGRFWIYLLLLGALTIATARPVAFGATLRSRLRQAGVLGALLCAPHLPIVPASLAALAAACAAILGAARGPRSDVRADKGGGHAGATAGTSQALVLLRVQCALLLHRHGHDLAMRLVLAALPLAGAWWMIVCANKTDEARGFIHVACALAAWFTSSLFHTLHVAGQTLLPYVRSTPSGTLRIALAGQALVLGASALLFCGAAAALGASLGARHPAVASMLGAGAFWLAWLPLFGLPVIQRHKDGILVKLVLAAMALLLVFIP